MSVQSLRNTVGRLHTVMIILTVLDRYEQNDVAKVHKLSLEGAQPWTQAAAPRGQPRSLPNLLVPELWHRKTTTWFKPMPICLKCFHKSATYRCSLDTRERSFSLLDSRNVVVDTSRFVCFVGLKCFVDPVFGAIVNNTNISTLPTRFPAH